ncbi:hypothetical protein B0H67DRAFT_681520 [Lasiosphaeris hirsuta]|uniref:Uncharacterized protein n=1 Tax=Lasiosphaeris hirsuta TaxID=260670 RepID=A0AA40AP84_9PEZI|nr:hypothetical protein B0H67DRAFT_681520 [Lasiosphaeris hirsuta]
MGAKALLQRLRPALRRKKNGTSTRGKDVGGPAKNGGDPGISSPSKTPIIIHQGPDSAQDAGVRTITRAEMQHSASNQDDSIFFSRLPLELRRQIYREVWRGYLKSRRVSPSSPGSDLRLHIYTDGSGRGTLRHTQCKIHPGAPGQDDAQVIEPWPFDRSNAHMPPMWFWFAWVMRLHWDKHWKCQHAIMKRWDPLTGNAEDAEPSPFLPLFLTCKKIYWEAMASLFENVTPIFTSSEDAHRFFIQKPHPFLGHIRSLEFSFTNSNDHLFLAQVLRESGSGKAASASVAAGASTGEHHPSTAMPCRLEIFGQQLWSELVQGVQSKVPDLRDFDITIGGRMAHNAAMVRFGCHQEEIAAEGDADTDVGVWQERDAPETWTLPGKLAVLFKTDERRYVQQGSKMVRQE